jgi:uncharacterized cupredoxin-like copper-binding protein
MFVYRQVTVVVLAAAATAAGGCGGGGKTGSASAPAGTQAPGAAVSKIGLSEFKFSPASATVKKGSTITVVSQGSLPHDLRLRKASQAKGGTAILAPGKQTTLEVNVAAGTYEMYCSVPGHEQSGMKGTFTVQ